MGKSERRKGADFERLICRMARASGRQAERSAPMQAGCTGHGDVLIDGLKCECKHRDDIPQWETIERAAGNNTQMVLTSVEIRRWATGHAALIVRKTGKGSYVLCRWRDSGRHLNCQVLTLAEWLAWLKAGDDNGVTIQMWHLEAEACEL